MATLNFPDNPTTGDTYTDSNSGFSYEWNGTVWISTDPSTASNIREIDDISGDFDDSETDFTLKVAAVNVEPVNAQQLIISLGGVMQNAGDDFTVSGSTITFTTAPQSGLSFFGTLLGTALSLNTIANGSVGSAALKTEDFTIGGSGNTVTIPGNLTVQGTETIINTERLDIQDKTVGIASTNAPSSTSQDDAGVIIYGQTDVNILYDIDKASLGISTAVTVTGVVTANGLSTNDIITARTLDTNGASVINIVSEGTTGTSRIKFSDTAGTDGLISYNHGDQALSLAAGGTTPQAYLTSAGKVGIGTDNPSKLLTVYGTSSSGFRISKSGVLAYDHTFDGSSYTIANNNGAAGIPIVFGTKTAGAESLRIDSSGNMGLGTDSPTSFGPTFQVSGTDPALILQDTATAVDYFAMNIAAGAVNAWYDDASALIINTATGISGSGLVERLRIDSNGNVGINTATPYNNAGTNLHIHSDNTTSEIRFTNSTTGGGNNGGTIQQGGNTLYVSNSESGNIVFENNGDERLRITSAGGFSFNNAQLVERVKITAGKLSDNTNIDLANGMVHYFSTTETTTSTPNIRIDGSNTLNNAMDTGDVIAVTLITTAAAAAYSAALNIDSSSATVEWSGAAAPAAGGASGLDVYAYTIIKTGSGAYKVLGNYTNFD